MALHECAHCLLHLHVPGVQSSLHAWHALHSGQVQLVQLQASYLRETGDLKVETILAEVRASVLPMDSDKLV